MQRLLPLVRRILAVALLASSVGTAAAQPVFPTGPGTLPYEPDLRFGMAFSGTLCRATHGDGGLIIAPLSKGTPCMYMPDPSRNLTTSYRVEATQRLRQGPAEEHFGIFFGDRSDAKRATYLTVTMTMNGAALEYFDGKQWQRLPPSTPAPKPRLTAGAMNRLAVEVRGNDVRAFLNGDLLASGVSPVPVDGRTGFYVDEVGQEAVYTEFKITSLVPVTTTVMTPPPAGGNVRMTPGGFVFLEDDLTAAQTFALIQDEFCRTAYADGGLRITGVGANGCEWYPGSLRESPMRARFELSSRLVNGDTAGMVLGYTSRADKLHYHFMTSASGQFVLEISQNGSSRALIPWTASSAVRTTAGATNRLSIEVDAQELRCFINGQFVGRAASPAIVQGSYGFILLGRDSVAVFSNLRITDLTGQTTVAKASGAVGPLAAAARPSSGQAPESRGGESPGRPKS